MDFGALSSSLHSEEPSDAESRQRPSRARPCMAVVVGGALVLCGFCALSAASGGGAFGLARDFVGVRQLADATQVIYIVRHGDKYSSYPKCKEGESPVHGAECFNKTSMGDNPPLTKCGVEQARHTAEWIANSSKGRTIGSIVASPFTRTLQTSLPLARLLNKSIKVEYLLSEARQPEGPFRPFNTETPSFVADQLEEVDSRWDLEYGSPPIKTPEGTPQYHPRLAKAVRVLKERFPPSSGDLAVFTHATPVFSIAYGLCSNLFGSLEGFVGPQEAVAPAGVIAATLDASGKCINLTQTQNVAEEVCECETEAYKCEFADYPSWYWEDPKGVGPERCH